MEAVRIRELKREDIEDVLKLAKEALNDIRCTFIQTSILFNFNLQALLVMLAGVFMKLINGEVIEFVLVYSLFNALLSLLGLLEFHRHVKRDTNSLKNWELVRKTYSCGFWVLEMQRENSKLSDKSWTIVGSVALRKPAEHWNQFVNHANAVEVKRMAVVPDQRNRGFGKKLLNHAESFAKSMKYNTIVLRTSSLRSSAVHLYERNGFESEHKTHLQLGRLFSLPLVYFLKSLDDKKESSI